MKKLALIATVASVVLLAAACSSKTDDKHECVDLGLSVKWATCNVGASSPYEYGDYFAWGETSPKSEYTNENCKTLELDIDDIAGNPKYDAARANWGDEWRMPTEEEMWELIRNCTWEWTSENGCNGYNVISNVNGNSIFLPATGRRCDLLLELAGEEGFYWSSTAFVEDDMLAACYLGINDTYDYDAYKRFVECWDRRFGLCIRPVMD